MKKTVSFQKMHGIGNDFVLIDKRNQILEMTSNFVKSLSDRHTGIGFDQLLLVEDSDVEGCDAAYRFYNPDGSQAEQCGNGQRCISKYLHQLEPTKSQFCLSGLAGLMYSEILENGDVRVNMGQTSSIRGLVINDQICFQVDFGNPHLVNVVDNVDNCQLSTLNQQLTKSYVNGINFEVVEILANDTIKIRVFERGTGETLACGSGACASVAALQSIGKLNNRVKVMLPGGDLVVEYQPSTNNLLLTGSATHVFTGEIKL
ncbi:MAG: diaminopimelate epimerase [Proteobacteria bacterium]|nr:diaminopimelate epimerase [Pseudomonadota bacterium]